MEDTFFKRHLWLGMVFGILLAVLGVFMMFQGDSFIKAFVVILGLFLIGSGLHTLLAMGSYAWGRRSKVATMIKGIISIGLGIVAVILPLATAIATWNIMLYIVGAQMAISAIVAFWDAMVLRKGTIGVSPLLWEGVVTLIIAVLLFLFSHQIGEFVLKLVGFVLLVCGAGLTVWSIRVRSIAKKMERQTIETTGEVEGE